MLQAAVALALERFEASGGDGRPAVALEAVAAAAGTEAESDAEGLRQELDRLRPAAAAGDGAAAAMWARSLARSLAAAALRAGCGALLGHATAIAWRAMAR